MITGFLRACEDATSNQSNSGKEYFSPNHDCQSMELHHIELHTCPFKVDVHNDTETLCECCTDCSRQCAMDI